MIDDRLIDKRRNELARRGWSFTKPVRDGNVYRMFASCGVTRAEFARTTQLWALADAVTWAGVEQELRDYERRPVAAE